MRSRSYGARTGACAVALVVCLLWAASACAHGDHLQVRRISPSGQDVQPGQEAVIQFDRKMVPLGHMGREKGSLPVSITPDPGCQWRWLDTSELACRLPARQRFAPATQYTIQVGTALKALDGSHLAKPVKRSFTTWRPKVHRTHFEEWQSPVMPVFRLRMNMRVTASEVAGHVGFRDGDDHWVKARVEPFTKKRQGPVWLPVPGAPGALLQVQNPKPDTPLDAKAKAAAGRRVWKVLPAKPLQADTEYHLAIKPGMRSPLGPLPGIHHHTHDRIRTYGKFTFRGIRCYTGSGWVHIGLDGSSSRCRPNRVQFQFSAPVPRATLAAVAWNPSPVSKSQTGPLWNHVQSVMHRWAHYLLPMTVPGTFKPVPASKLATFWRDYPQWYLRMPRNPRDADHPDHYPLSFTLDAMRRYALTVPAGIKDRFGRTLAHPVHMSFRTGHRRPFFNTPPSESILEAGQPTIVPLRFTNLDRLLFHYRLLDAGQLASGSGAGELHARDLLQRSDLQAPRDRIVEGNLGVRKLLDDHDGVVSGTLDWSPRRARRPYVFLGEVTPWQVSAKFSHYNLVVWVSRFDNGKPVAGAKVKLLRGSHDDLSKLTNLGDTVTTNAHGIAVLPGTARMHDAWFHRWKHHANFYIGVDRGKHMALLPLDGHFHRYIGDAANYSFFGHTEPRYGHMRAWAVTEQGIYKPGSDVQYAAFVRAEGASALKAPPALDYTLTIVDPQGNDVLKREHVTLSRWGEARGKVHIPAAAPMGKYDIKLSWPTKTGTAHRSAGQFTVTDFVPSSFKVDTLVKGTRFAPGDHVATRVSAKLHAGGPYSDAKVKVTTKLVPEPFSPDTSVASGFRFRPLKDTPSKPKTLAQTTGKLDHSGHAHTTVALPDKTDIIHGKVKVEGAVESSRGTWVAHSASVPFASRGRFVGLRTRNWMQTAGKPFKVQYLVVNPAGKPEAGSKVAVRLQRRQVSRVRVKNASGHFDEEEHTRWVTEDQCQAASVAAPASCQLTPKQAGRYRIVATTADSHGREQTSVLSTWVTGAGSVVWSHAGKGVTLVPDKSEYHVGDTAHVLVQNPYPGAQALVTVERYGVLWKKVITLTGSAPVIDVPITADCFPGAYLSVSIFSPRASAPADPDLGRPELALGYVALKITGKGSSLDVNVKPARSTYKPRQSVDVDVAVKKHDGKSAGHTRLVVAVVDQGVIDLLSGGTGYYDPRRTFYAPPDGPDVRNYSLAEQLLTALQPKSGKGENPGGGGGGSTGPNVRSNFSYATYWNPDLETDASGHAHFQFKLPDNLTRWRILVVAMSTDDAMGLGKGGVRVNLPLQIKPALPNQMHVGDHFGAAFNVTNRTKNPLQVDTHIDAGGAIKGGKASAGHVLKLASFGHGLSWLPLDAVEPGEITLTGTARSGKLGDAVRAHIPVRRAGADVVAAEYGSTTGDDAKVAVKVPAKAISGSSRITVAFAPTLVGGLDGAFEVMRDDPLYTWEVQLSRGVLASDYLRLKPVLGDSVEWQDAGKAIDNMLKQAANFQAPNGGMAFWVPRNRFVSKYLSVYTALAFDWLDAAGHKPPARVRKRLTSYLHDTILGGKNRKPGHEVLRAGALAALALAPDGKLPKGAVAGMLPKLHKLRLFGQALLLDAAVAGHDRDSADKIARSLLSYAEESAGEISFNKREQGAYVELLATPLRANCAILDALSRYKTAWGTENLLGDVPQKSMRWITGRRRNEGGWTNSQENVFCTTAITHYADAYEQPVKALVGKWKLPSGKPQSATFTSRATPAVKLEGPTAKPGQDFNVDLERSGQGRLYYHVQVHYAVPPETVPAADAGMTLSRHYFVQRKGDWKPVKQGTELKRGDIVRVDLDVDAPTERHHVVLTDPLPGAFEAVNRMLATAADTTPAKQPGTSVLMFTGGAWPNMSVVSGGFYHRETSFRAVRFFADSLPAGHYRVVYAAQVIAPGKFIAPAPEIKEIYQPDVFGRGTARHIQVSMPEH